MKPIDVARKYRAENSDTPLSRLAAKMVAENPDIWNSASGAESALRRAAGKFAGKTRKRDRGNQSEKAGAGLTVDDQPDKGTMVIDSRSRRITTVDQLIAHCEIDLDVWKVERGVANKWEVGAVGKGDDADLLIRPLIQVKVWFKRKESADQGSHIADALMAAFKKQGPIGKKPKVKKTGKLVEMALFDVHVGKLCWAAETGTDYDSKIAIREFGLAVESFLRRAGDDVERIVFPVGNDFLNSDNSRGETTAGTRQDEDSRWQKSFADAQACLVRAITRCAEVAPVDVVVVSGNHDMERMYYMGQVLEAYFTNHAGVTVDNRPTLRKCYQWGKNFIGYTHGNKEKHADLPLIFATDYPMEFATSTHKEIHIGHFHQGSEKIFNTMNEKCQVRLRIIASLAGTDAWHRSKGYTGVRASEAFVYLKRGGMETHLNYFPGS